MEPEPKKSRAPVRVWCDGCYDMCHFGHSNSFRQAKAMGDVLVVGVHSDDEVSKHKGPPMMTDEERYKMVRSVKWVDEVIEDAPYITYVSTLDKYKCDFCVHGDDISTSSDGTDSYAEVKNADRFKECRRTTGISTTDIVGRLLLATRQRRGGKESPLESMDTQALGSFVEGFGGRSAQTGVSHFLPTTQKIIQFSSGRVPGEGDKIIYTVGSFDIFHCGHVDFLKKAKELGDFVIVGVNTDQDVNYYKGGGNFPIMTLHERVLSVLACRYVDEVVIGAPYEVTQELIDHFKITVVAHGKTPIVLNQEGKDPFHVPKQLGIFQVIDSGNKMTSQTIIDRIIAQRLMYEERNRKKSEQQKIQNALAELQQRRDSTS
ncbi:ethanolamine-phosphate cytidylyltransferase-like [Corticium candelabrum]|uniref:ethanolamine-phosphate cytidylyltransferase-like n=1 Tax=Corticium candelabrum TaxID=121492 RepID=UPI002E26B6E2|nr:ethanolamine-phosphate cytidylyltransferase-like [Corticium candelabrum]